MAIRTRQGSGGATHASGASAVAKQMLSKNGLMGSRTPGFKRVTSRASTLRVGGGANAVASTAIQPPEEEEE